MIGGKGQCILAIFKLIVRVQQLNCISNRLVAAGVCRVIACLRHLVTGTLLQLHRSLISLCFHTAEHIRQTIGGIFQAVRAIIGLCNILYDALSAQRVLCNGIPDCPGSLIVAGAGDVKALLSGIRRPARFVILVKSIRQCVIRAPDQRLSVERDREAYNASISFAVIIGGGMEDQLLLVGDGNHRPAQVDLRDRDSNRSLDRLKIHLIIRGENYSFLSAVRELGKRLTGFP